MTLSGKIKKSKKGVFMNFEELGKSGKEYAYKFDRDKQRNEIIGIELIKKNLIYVKNSDGFIEVANRKKAELLGIVYYHKPWKKFVWEQCEGIILSSSCGKELFDWIHNLARKDLT